MMVNDLVKRSRGKRFWWTAIRPELPARPHQEETRNELLLERLRSEFGLEPVLPQHRNR